MDKDLQDLNDKFLELIKPRPVVVVKSEPLHVQERVIKVQQRTVRFATSRPRRR